MKNVKRLLLIVVGLIFLTGGVCPLFAQKKIDAFKPESSLPETLDWLNKAIPLVYFLPASGGSVRTLEKIWSVSSADCTLSFEIRSEYLGKDNFGSSGTPTPGAPVGPIKEWAIDLKALEPDSIRFVDVQDWTPANVRFAAARGVKAIKVYDVGRDRTQATRYLETDHVVVQNKAKGNEIAAALRRAVELCHGK